MRLSPIFTILSCVYFLSYCAHAFLTDFSGRMPRNAGIRYRKNPDSGLSTSQHFPRTQSTSRSPTTVSAIALSTAASSALRWGVVARRISTEAVTKLKVRLQALVTTAVFRVFSLMKGSLYRTLRVSSPAVQRIPPLLQITDPLDQQASLMAAQRYAESRIREIDAASARYQSVPGSAMTASGKLELDFLRLSVRHLLGRADWASMGQEDAVRHLKVLDIDSVGINKAMNMFLQLPYAAATTSLMDLRSMPGLGLHLWAVYFLNSRLIFSTCWSPAFESSSGSSAELEGLVQSMVERLGDRSDEFELSVRRAKEMLSAFKYLNSCNPQGNGLSLLNKKTQYPEPTAFRVLRPLSVNDESDVIAFVANHTYLMGGTRMGDIGSPLSFLRLNETQARKAIEFFLELRIPGADSVSRWEDIKSIPLTADVLSASFFLHANPMTSYLSSKQRFYDLKELLLVLSDVVHELQGQIDTSNLSEAEEEVNDVFRRRGLDIIDRLELALFA